MAAIDEPAEPSIAVLGLGYVGLPLAVVFGKHYPTLGFDIDEIRIGQLREGFDMTREVLAEDICRPRMGTARVRADAGGRTGAGQL